MDNLSHDYSSTYINMAICYQEIHITTYTLELKQLIVEEELAEAKLELLYNYYDDIVIKKILSRRYICGSRKCK